MYLDRAFPYHYACVKSISFHRYLTTYECEISTVDNSVDFSEMNLSSSKNSVYDTVCLYVCFV